MVQEELGQEDPQPVLRREWEQGGLVYPVNSPGFHDSSSLQAKFLKGAEENQVERNVLIATIVAAHPCTDGTQRSVEEQLGTHKPHTVWIK